MLSAIEAYCCETDCYTTWSGHSTNSCEACQILKSLCRRQKLPRHHDQAPSRPKPLRSLQVPSTGSSIQQHGDISLQWQTVRSQSNVYQHESGTEPEGYGKWRSTKECIGMIVIVLGKKTLGSIDFYGADYLGNWHMYGGTAGEAAERDKSVGIDENEEDHRAKLMPTESVTLTSPAGSSLMVPEPSSTWGLARPACAVRGRT